MTYINGALRSPSAGPILRQGAPAFWRDEETPYVILVVAGADAYAAPIAEMSIAICDDLSNFDLDLKAELGPDVATRWLASHFGLDVGLTAPTWCHLPGTTDPERPDRWAVICVSGDVHFFVEDGVLDHALKGVSTIPGISKAASLVEALALTCTTVGAS